MNDMTNSPVCERAPDLMAFLYHEMNEGETREFELHLQQCGNCREELASFGMVRESITEWRNEALSGFVSTPPVTKIYFTPMGKNRLLNHTQEKG